MKKIVIITGGIGYIGTEICKIYSGESWNNQITVIDNRFISERVNQLRKWNINFVHVDIRKTDEIKKYLNEADVVHHLAGITDVPRTEAELNEAKDNELMDIAEKGTEIVLSETSKNCKIIFPSTHVVFEGKQDLIKDISEKFEKLPTLPYAKSKDDNEEQIIKSGKNLCNTQTCICIWLFNRHNKIKYNAKFILQKLLQDGTIKTFGGGKQLKTLVPLIDTARCFKFMEEKDGIKKEIFNVSKDTITVEEVAILQKN